MPADQRNRPLDSLLPSCVLTYHPPFDCQLLFQLVLTRSRVAPGHCPCAPLPSPPSSALLCSALAAMLQLPRASWACPLLLLYSLPLLLSCSLCTADRPAPLQLLKRMPVVGALPQQSQAQAAGSSTVRHPFLQWLEGQPPTETQPVTDQRNVFQAMQHRSGQVASVAAGEVPLVPMRPEC